MATKTDRPAAEWMKINPATLSPETRSLHDEYLQVAKFAAEAREKFESALEADHATAIPVGQRLLFSYRFGLSIALVPDDRKPKASAKPTTLADFLAARRMTGDRC